MTITKCDLCRKQVRKRESKITVSLSNPWRSAELCTPCAKPILDFLKKNNLIEEDDA